MKLVFACVLVALSGFIALSYEILWFRVFAFATGGAAITFSALLGAYLLGIALGSLGSGRFCRDDGAFSPQQLKVVALFILLGNIAGFYSVPYIADQFAAGLFGGGQFSNIVPFLPVVFVSALLGAQFPLISHYGVEPDELAGSRLSILYLSNILGSVLGSLLTGFVLLDRFSIADTAVILTSLGVILAVTLLFAVLKSGRAKLGAIAVGVATTLGVGLNADWAFHHIYEKLFYKSGYDEDVSFKYVIENKSGVITVDQGDLIFGGGLYDGVFSTSLTEDRNIIKRAYLLSLFHPEPKKVLMIGLSSGSWATVYANHPQLESLTVVEINPGYVELIEKYPEQRKILDDPKVNLVMDDGRRFLNRTDEKYDLIVINTTFHWRSQISNLLSVEFNQLVQEHLREGGIYQFNTTGSTESIRAAFDVFPYVVGSYNHILASDSPMVPDTERWRDVIGSYSIYGSPVLDLDTPENSQTMAEMIGWTEELSPDQPLPFQEEATLNETYQRMSQSYFVIPQVHLEPIIQDVEPITDDNMGVEWKHRISGK